MRCRRASPGCSAGAASARGPGRTCVWHKQSRRRKNMLGRPLLGAIAGGLAAPAIVRAAEQAPGVTKTSIKIGQTMPYSGPASAYGVIGQTEAAFFKGLNM